MKKIKIPKTVGYYFFQRTNDLDAPNPLPVVVDVWKDLTRGPDQPFDVVFPDGTKWPLNSLVGIWWERIAEPDEAPCKAVPMSELQLQGLRLKHLGEMLMDEDNTIPALAVAAAECGLVLKFKIDPIKPDEA